jgi:hypothetical protein
MKMIKKMLLATVVAGLLATSSPVKANLVLLDFEDMSDLTSVGESYASDGIHFNNAISLTAGFSLNEFDFPPSSGDVAIGDDLGPIEIRFDNLTQDISANFTYGSQLTFFAYDSTSSLIGTYVHPSLNNYGLTEQISLSFTGVSSLMIAGEWDGSFIMDDFGFDSAAPAPAPVPEPTAMLLVGTGLVGLVRSMKRKRNDKRPQK